MGPVSKKTFLALRVSVWSKYKLGLPPPPASPLDPPLDIIPSRRDLLPYGPMTSLLKQRKERKSANLH